MPVPLAAKNQHPYCRDVELSRAHHNMTRSLRGRCRLSRPPSRASPQPGCCWPRAATERDAPDDSR
eukprot:scaffold4812_cov88-Phaeocystis_antarctica.AAC.6